MKTYAKKKTVKRCFELTGQLGGRGYQLATRRAVLDAGCGGSIQGRGVAKYDAELAILAKFAATERSEKRGNFRKKICGSSQCSPSTVVNENDFTCSLAY